MRRKTKRERIGLYLALGGTDRLDEAVGGQLEDLVARRTRRASSGFVRGPLAVHITRARGFNASRAPCRLHEGEVHLRSLFCFDCITREKAMAFKTRLEAVVAED